MNATPINVTPMPMFDWSKQETMRILQSIPGTQYQEANDIGKKAICEWLRSLLQFTPITVTFVKADGTLRDMNCTLNWQHIPDDKRPKASHDMFAPLLDSIDGILGKATTPKIPKAPSELSLRVFDIEKNEWRSFRLDRMKKITATLSFE